jgi:iron complex outermembrane receptor protein
MKFLLILSLIAPSAFAEESAIPAYALPEIKVETDSAVASYINSLPAVSTLSGNQLQRRKQSSLGETLSREAGVSSSYFGPNASRPIIRGLDGDRIRIMENGTGTLDASAASPDHAVSVDPLVVNSIEIIRGPSALLYGSTAIGGVVNVKTARISNRMIDADSLKMAGNLSSVDQGRALGGMAHVKSGQWVFEMDASGRGSENYSIPGFARSSQKQTQEPLAAGETEESKRVENSANRSYQGGMGATYLLSDGHFGAAFSAIQSQYGTVAEKSVQINLQRFRLDLEAEKKLSTWVEQVRIKGSATVYRHQEIDAGEVGTTFRNKGGELRADFKHRKVGSMEGVFGFQSQLFQFSALGEEAFLPTTLNHSNAVFAFEEWTVGQWKPSAGIRLDLSGVKAKEDTRFGAEKSVQFFAPAGSLGLAYQLSTEQTLGVTGTYTERAPNYQEIFAQGDHVATNVFERGDRNLRQERSVGAEVFYKSKNRTDQFRASIFAQSFSSYIALLSTGVVPADSADGLEESQFRSVSALLTGAEMQWAHEWPLVLWDGRFETELQADFVRGINRSQTGNLPRIPPVREGLTLNYKNQGWLGFVQYQRSEQQGLITDNELSTDAYTFINAGVEAPVTTAFGSFRITFRLNNIFDHEGRVHSSFLKDVAPLPGRNAMLSMQASL